MKIEKNGFLLACFLFCALTFLADGERSLVSAASAKGTPLDAIKTAQTAVDASDIDLFRTVVDMDALLQSASEDARKELVSLYRAGELEGLEPALAAMLAEGDGFAAQVAMQVFFQDIKDYVTIGIGNGYFSGSRVLSEGQASPFPGIMKHASSAKKEIKVGKVISQSGNRAVVSATLVDHEVGSYPLNLGLTKQTQGWRVDSVTNTRSLVRSIVKSSK